jgi:hypothetical protein
MNAEIAVGGVDAKERCHKLQAAVDSAIGQLHEKFPEAQGYAYRTQPMVARWVDHSKFRGTSQEQWLEELDPETRWRAYRRQTQVKRGGRWGFVIDIEAADSEIRSARISLRRESQLALYLAGGLATVVAIAAFLIALTLDPRRGREIGLALLASIFAGVGGAFLGWILSRPLEALKVADLKALLDGATACMEREVGSR